MTIFESAFFLVIGTALLTLSAISFALFPRPASLENPTFLVQAIAAAGAVFLGLGARGIHRVHRFLSGSGPAASSGGPPG